MSSPSDTDPTQLLRYVLQLENLTDPERISEVREQLTNLGLVVDRISEGEVEVAVSQARNPGAEGIKQALQAAGFSVVSITAETG
jgi:hypothetical protein